jgi:hypothetical protein
MWWNKKKCPLWTTTTRRGEKTTTMWKRWRLTPTTSQHGTSLYPQMRTLSCGQVKRRNRRDKGPIWRRSSWRRLLHTRLQMARSSSRRSWVVAPQKTPWSCPPKWLKVLHIPCLALYPC